MTADCADALDAEQLEAVAAEARRTTTAAERARNPALLLDGPRFDPAAQAAYVDHVVRHEAQELGVPEATVREVVAWFHALVRRHSVVASDLIGGRLYKRDKHGRRAGAVFDAPGGVRASAWVRMLGRCVQLLARNPLAIAERVPGLRAAFAAQIEANAVGPLFRQAGTPATRLALTAHDLPALDDRVLYYKFKADTYKHYAENHRAVDVPCGAHACAGLAVVWRGNSGASAYGGPGQPPRAQAGRDD